MATVRGPFSKATVRLSHVDVDTVIGDLNSDRLPVVALRVTDAFLAAKGGFIGPDGRGTDGHALISEAALSQCAIGSFVIDPNWCRDRQRLPCSPKPSATPDRA